MFFITGPHILYEESPTGKCENLQSVFSPFPTRPNKYSSILFALHYCIP